MVFLYLKISPPFDECPFEKSGPIRNLSKFSSVQFHFSLNFFKWLSFEFNENKIKSVEGSIRMSRLWSKIGHHFNKTWYQFRSKFKLNLIIIDFSWATWTKLMYDFGSPAENDHLFSWNKSRGKFDHQMSISKVWTHFWRNEQQITRAQNLKNIFTQMLFDKVFHVNLLSNHIFF